MTKEFETKLRELREAKGIMPATIDEYPGIMRGSCTNWENRTRGKITGRNLVKK